MRGDYVALTIGVDRVRKKEGLVQAHQDLPCISVASPGWFPTTSLELSGLVKTVLSAYAEATEVCRGVLF